MLGAGRSYVTPRGHVTPEVTLKAWPFHSRSQVQRLAGEGQQPAFNFSLPIDDHEMQKKDQVPWGGAKTGVPVGTALGGGEVGKGGGGASRSTMDCACMYGGEGCLVH